ncbi:MAG TPA: hypothetical protein VGY13_13525 [Solirubrobacteraceae bacterium]|nr:hypothetical protein [Solirubrobacteraceae bacterium]
MTPAAAVLAREAAHVAGDHHAVAWADAGLVAGRAFEFAAGALADEQRLGGRAARAHDQLVGDFVVDGDRFGRRVLRLGELRPGEAGVLGEHFGDRGVLELFVQLEPVFAHVGREVELVGAGDADQGHRDDARPDGAAFDVVEVVGGVDERPAEGRADDLRVQFGGIGGGELGSPLGRDRAAGVADQADLARAGEPGGGGGERGAQRVERVDPVDGAGGEVGFLALGVGHHDRVAGEQRGRDDRGLDVGDQPAEAEPAGDRVGGLVFVAQRVVEGLVGDDRGRPQAHRREQHRGDVHGRLADGAGGAVEQLHGGHGQRHAGHVVGERARLQHRPVGDAGQRRAAFVAVEGVFGGLERGPRGGRDERRPRRQRERQRHAQVPAPQPDRPHRRPVLPRFG